MISECSACQKPLALTFSKIDAFINGLEASGQSIPGIDLESNSTFLKTGKFSLEHVDAIDSTLLGALNEYCDGLGLSESFDSSAFVGIRSQTGV